MMGLENQLQINQSQKIIITPKLSQALKVLQLSSMDLRDYVDEMIAENPLLEINNESVVESPTETRNEIDWEEYSREIGESLEPRIPKEQKEKLSYENITTMDASFYEYLLSQLGVLKLKVEDFRIARYLIGNIDSCGYLTVSAQQAQADLNVAAVKIKEMISIVQSLDPPGIGANNVKECLLIQLAHKGMCDEVLCNLVENHLENISEGRFSRIARSLNISVTRVQELADLIKSLNPKPGASFGSDQTRYIVPDVVIERVEGEYSIYLNDKQVPHLTINDTYRSLLKSNKSVDNDTKCYVENKLNQALWLIQSIEQRLLTIFRVATALVEFQREFFDYGVKYIKPLNLKQIATEIGMHESTVSRATTNKYIQTPQGVFEFKFFFNTGINTERGGNESSVNIKRLLKDMVKGEDATKPFSDQKLADIFKSRGVDIARRTISKYRDELGIPSTGNRKRY
ncbi:MAG: RNA polymerase factor sigma-54 [Ruminiclostridium sp.]